MKMTFFPFLFLSFIAFNEGYSQNADTLGKIKSPVLIWSGFVRADALYDTRQVTEAREGYLLLYPKDVLNDREGNDVNAHGSFNQYAMTARLTAKISGPDILGARAMALIEGDFTGASNAENNSFRLRHAYARLTWPGVTLLAGQYWHPMDVPEMIPDVLSLNTGAPFHSYSRQPQVRSDIKLGRINLVLAATSQRDYVNNGPAGNTYLYLRNSGIPNLHLQVQYSSGKFFAGAGFDFKRLVPRLITDSSFKASESINSYAALAFLKISLNSIVVKAEATYGQNLNDHLMLGGYGVNSTDRVTNRQTYSALNYFSGWCTLNTTGKIVQFSVFAGYTKGYGARDVITGPVYARDANIDYAYRIAPMLSWFAGKMAFVLELEYTIAAYGQADKYYRISSPNEVANLRSTISIACNF